MTKFQSINPADSTLIDEHTLMSSSEVNDILNRGVEAFNQWRSMPIERKAPYIHEIGEVLLSKKESFAKMITLEMGKVYGESLSEVEKCARVCIYYAEQGPDFLKPETIGTEARESYISYQPLGLVLGIMPWNFPFWQVFRYAIPTLLAGNVCLLKHAPNVMRCAKAIEEVFQSVDLPKGLFANLVIDTDKTGNLIEDPRVAAVTITGSTRAGKSVASRAGSALKKSVMELGGSDPYVILKDADLDLAVDVCCKSRLLNAGQSCIAAKRFIVVDHVYDSFMQKFKRKLETQTYGDPMSEVAIGPLARKDLRDNLDRQVQESVSQGARLLLGGAIPESPGFFYPVTLLDNVSAGMPAFDEELFGPVASVICAPDEEQAIALANQTVYGLGAAVFTKDMDKGRMIAEQRLDAGCCFVNQLVHSDPRLPFGGVGESGYGRELGPLGIKEFVNAKTVYVA